GEALQRLESKDFRLQISKCEFSVSRINFLGHIISADGVTPDPKNVQPILDAPTPKTLKQGQSLLGMVNYYHDFIKNLSTTAEPLRRLTRKGVKFHWSTECSQAFERLKSDIAGEVRNFIFDPNAPTFFTTDASDVGLGAVLNQRQHGREVPIAYASHTLQPRERSFATNEKEALACI
ncbi:polyprotein, partial [Elysia marginata]